MIVGEHENSSDELELWKRGSSPFLIHVVDNGARADDFIVAEATTHIERMTGEKPVFARIADAECSLPETRMLLMFDDGLEYDESNVEVRGDSLVVAGGGQRGLYYGMLEFFEHLGCRWFAPGEFGTVYPSLDRISVRSSWTFHHKPSMKWRGLHICGSGRDADGERVFHYDYETALWMIRNRMNFKPIHNTEYDDVAPMLERTLLSPLAFGHSYRDWIRVEEHDENPEFSPIIGGERFRGGQLCLSNEKMKALLVDRIVAFIDAHPDLPVVSLAPEDGYRWCECADCAEMDSEEDKAKGELNRRTHLFTAEIAARVASKRPGKIVSGISYCNYLECSEDAPFVDSLGVSMCVTRALNRSLRDESSPSNVKLNKRLSGWLRKAGQVFWSAYYLSYGGTFPRAFYYEISDSVRHLVESGVAGLKSEVSPGNFPQWRSAVFFLYLVARTLYDAEVDPDALLADFCSSFYGPAAAECKAFHKLNQRLFTDSPVEFTSVTPDLLPLIYSGENIERLLQLSDSALRKVVNRGGFLVERVELLKKQAEELQRSRDAVLASSDSSVSADFAASEPDFADFANVKLTEQLQRKNMLPYPEPNHFALKWTVDGIWIYFLLGEPDARISRKTAENGSTSPFGASNVDCFLAPDPDSGDYFQFSVDIAGRIYSAKCNGRRWNPGHEFNPVVKLRHSSRSWELLIGLSYSDLETGTPTSETKWRAAFNRGQQCDSPATLGGWPGGGVWHDVKEMGTLSFNKQQYEMEKANG